MGIIHWLHVSDLHYGYESYGSCEMRSSIVRRLPDALADCKLDYLFITGDLRYGKNCGNKFPPKITEDIESLVSAFGISQNHVHIVMGNHDVTREHSREDIAPLLQDEYLKTETLKKDRMKSLERSQHKFYGIYRAICGREAQPYHYVVKEP